MCKPEGKAPGLPFELSGYYPVLMSAMARIFRVLQKNTVQLRLHGVVLRLQGVEGVLDGADHVEGTEA